MAQAVTEYPLIIRDRQSECKIIRVLCPHTVSGIAAVMLCDSHRKGNIAKSHLMYTYIH